MKQIKTIDPEKLNPNNPVIKRELEKYDVFPSKEKKKSHL